MNLRLAVCAIILIHAKRYFCDDSWGSPPFIDAGNDLVSFTLLGGNIAVLYMDEEIDPDIRIVRLNYTGESEPTIYVDEGSGDMLGAEMVQEVDDYWTVVVTNKIDFEQMTPFNRFSLQISINSTPHESVILYINNIDDNPPVILASNPCEIEENSVNRSDCLYNITDIDGWLQPDYISWTIEGNRGEADLFDFDYLTEDITNNTNLVTLVLKTVSPLDYEKITVHLFIWTVFDSGRNNATATIVVNVIDMPDTPPVWTQIFTTEQFDEKSEQRFQIEAVDGDYGVNDDITYSLQDFDWSDAERNVTIDVNTGEIFVTGIDRDYYDRGTYSFLVVATEVHEPWYSTSRTLIFEVIDINDNKPTFVSPDTKKLYFRIPEARFTQLNDSMRVIDIDTGENAYFLVYLNNKDADIDYRSAFQVVPSTRSYRDMTFTLSIINNALLDYEEEDWQSFGFIVFAEESKNTSHVDSVEVEIDLINLNDEIPIFDEEEYNVPVNETIGIDELIIQVTAIDRDIDDQVVYELVGSSMNRMFVIDELTGEIKTKIDRAFNYGRQSEVIIQVAAKDTLIDEYNSPLHTTYVQVNVEVLDINDETPIISVRSSTSFEENLADGTIIETNITASDEDSTAELVFSIDWESSNAYKNGGSVDLDKYKGFLIVNTNNIDESTGYVQAEFHINELVLDNTPDYEIFDTIYLVLVVTDLQQQVGIGTATATLVIIIIDVNDNKPIFTNSIEADISVTEMAAVGTTIGTITATDIDGPLYNNVTYYLNEVDGTPAELVSIDLISGQLSVKSSEIHADDPPTWYLTYTVIATDSYWETLANISILIRDTNNHDPEFVDFEDHIYLEEKSETGTEVVQVTATDKDRDSQFNLVWYQFSGASTAEFRIMFSIDQDTGQIIVNYTSDTVLDRDKGTKEFTFFVRASDNIDLIGGVSRSQEKELTITLTDINDQEPIITTESIIVNENSKEGDVIPTEIVAIDLDEPGTINTKINFIILGISNDSDGDFIDGMNLFEISTDENYESGIARLTVLKNLEGYYGQFYLVIKTHDFGTHPKEQEHINYLNLIIEKYNFLPPVFIYPQQEEWIMLSKSSALNSQLYTYDGRPLDNIQADDQQGGKWDIIFIIESDDDSSEIFAINNDFGQSTGMLQLRNVPNLDSQYTFNIIANDNGSPPFTASMLMHIRFFETGAVPYFSEDQRMYTVSFTENSTGLTESRTIYQASYIGGDIDWDINLPIYYLLFTADIDSFAVDEITGTITLTEMLDREEQDTHVIKIVAANNINIPNNPDDKSILTITVQVLDINDNPPHFNSSFYSGGISTADLLHSTVVTLEAYDLDSSDEGKLIFAIDGVIERHGNAISSINDPFVLNPSTGIITLNFGVQANMDGYFRFNAIVQDSPPQNYTDTALIQIYIVTEQNKVEFRFENTLDEVIAMRPVIISVLDSTFTNHTCNIESVLSDTDENDSGALMANRTVVTTHFISKELNQPADKTEIQRSLTDIEFFSTLRVTFSQYGLELYGFFNSNPNSGSGEEHLRDWLIGLSAVLSVLFVTLLTISILKINSLNKRLKNLSAVKFGSQESGLNRIGVAAPNTNRNATEGSNPVYNEEKKMPDIDQSSIYSGDSDLIGVEDNPEFDMALAAINYGYNSKE